MGFVFIGSGVVVVHFVSGEREESFAFGEAEHDINLCDVVVELFHEVFSDELSPALLVGLVHRDGTDDVVVDHVAMLEDVSGQFHEHQILDDVAHSDLLTCQLQDHHTLLLQLVRVRRLGVYAQSVAHTSHEQLLDRVRLHEYHIQVTLVVFIIHHTLLHLLFPSLCLHSEYLA